jgi:hypothetical protein
MNHCAVMFSVITAGFEVPGVIENKKRLFDALEHGG